MTNTDARKKLAEILNDGLPVEQYPYGIAKDDPQFLAILRWRCESLPKIVREKRLAKNQVRRLDKLHSHTVGFNANVRSAHELCGKDGAEGCPNKKP